MKTNEELLAMPGLEAVDYVRDEMLKQPPRLNSFDSTPRIKQLSYQAWMLGFGRRYYKEGRECTFDIDQG